MEIRIRLITVLQDALGFAGELDRYAAESMAEFRDSPLEGGVAAKLLERHFEHSACQLLIAENAGGGKIGLCLSTPFEDPLTAEITPIIVILRVDDGVRHCGVARALVKDLMRLLIARGHTSLAARAAHNDDALISMGERWGFLRHWELMLHE